jgi:uncharacterized membrane protein
MQLFLAYFFFVRRIEAILVISPIIIFAGFITGTFNGIVTNLIIKKIRQSQKSAPVQ